MNFVLFDDSSHEQLLPLTLTRPVADIRIGILTIREKWEKYLGRATSTYTKHYLREKFPLANGRETLLINGSVLPSEELLKAIQMLRPNESYVHAGNLIARYISDDNPESSLLPDDNRFINASFDQPLVKIDYPWDIFSKNAEVISGDFELLTSGRNPQTPDTSNTIIGEGKLFIEKNATVRGATLNTDNGPIYIGEGAEVMEGSIIRGPFALCNNATVKMGAKIYGPTTIGPHSKVGGELNNVVVFGYSNKAHDGFLGNSVIGEWCNLGADTNSSNLKNTYEEVKVWSYQKNRFTKTGLQFCGLIMGDHSKCGINTMFNTGTVVGMSANIYGPGFQRNFIKSFSWGGTHGMTEYNIDKAIKVARIVYGRRGMEFSEKDENIFRHIHKASLSSYN